MAKLHLLPIVIGAAVGVGAYVLGKYLSAKEEEDLVEGDVAGEEPADEPASDEETLSDSAPEQPAAQPAPEEPVGTVNIPIATPDDETPNANPVRDVTEPAKRNEDGTVDPTTIAKAEDFGNWEETGCRG